MKLDKTRQLVSNGNAMTQSLFYEHKYDKDVAIFTLGEEDKVVDGKTFPSLKRLYLEFEDPTEYAFAKEYLYSWQQWQRLSGSQFFAKHIRVWREELEFRIRSQAVKDIIDMTANDGSFQAAKWLADRGWEKRGAGRPTKEETENRLRQDQNLNEEFTDEFARLKIVKK